ncbi:hemolysin III [Enemella dayhoffiae]|uniref:Hemolysin III n=1 Tax=Enemella dayhoffiae TaxID=2016507 RepID=A0A255GQP2_9ACTN|nr:hemolysin III family protein [Enemella dayhoffiae]OYO18135.1 hemolysin III [Enemella dayhoffiae]
MKARPLPHEVADAVGPLKPKLRGWLHAGWTPLALLGGLILVIGAPTLLGRIGGAVFLAGSLLLFGTSAIYHRFHWGDRATAVLRRLDHANIFVFIAATYTPLSLLLLQGKSRIALLIVVWSAGLLGLLFRVLWLSAPRWLYTVLYLAMGWAALGWLNQFWANGGPLVFTLIVAGGICYSLGAVVYGRKRPDPSPAWFGFHEIFHSFTILGSACHYTAIALATFR